MIFALFLTLVYRQSTITCIQPILTTVGKLDELNIRTNVLDGFMIPSRRTVFLGTSVTKK